jgi:sugar phosphate isomerase/epimerase
MPLPQLKFIRALWGAEGQFSTDVNILFGEFHRLGYAGVEVTLSDIHRISANDPDAFLRALHDNELEFVGLVQTNYPNVKNDIWQDLSVDQHVANLEQHLEEFMRYKPIHVNIQGGQDSWSVEENEQFFQKALEVQAKYSQVSSSHEVSIVSHIFFEKFQNVFSNLKDSSNSFTLQSVHY